MKIQEKHSDIFEYDIVRKAFLFATEAHQNQKYADIHPYTLHLLDVMMTLVQFGIIDPHILAAALLHDVIEDTPYNYADVKNRTDSELVADIVYAVTDELGRNRKERKERTLPKLDKFLQAQYVKLADWISNVRQCYRNSHKMYQMYKKDYKSFRKFRGQFSDSRMHNMWDELDKLLSKDPKTFDIGLNIHHNEFDGDSIRE